MDGIVVSNFGRVAKANDQDLIPLLPIVQYATYGNATIENWNFVVGGSMGDMGRDLAYAGVFTAPIAVFNLTPGATYRWIRGTQEQAYADFQINNNPVVRITHPGTTGEGYDFVVPDGGWIQGMNRTPLMFWNTHGGPPPWNDSMNHKLIGLGYDTVATQPANSNKFIEINGVRLYFGTDNPPSFPAPAGSFYFNTSGGFYTIANPITGIWSANAGFV